MHWSLVIYHRQAQVADKSPEETWKHRATSIEREGICKIKLMKLCETVVFDDFGLAALCVLVSHHRPEFVQYLWLNC